MATIGLQFAFGLAILVVLTALLAALLGVVTFFDRRHHEPSRGSGNRPLAAGLASKHEGDPG